MKAVLDLDFLNQAFGLSQELGESDLGRRLRQKERVMKLAIELEDARLRCLDLMSEEQGGR